MQAKFRGRPCLINRLLSMKGTACFACSHSAALQHNHNWTITMTITLKTTDFTLTTVTCYIWD